MRKWLIGLGAALGVLILVLVALIAWLLYTPSGLRFALDRGVALTHGEFSYASAYGTLAGEAVIDGLRYRDDSGDRLRIRSTRVDLRPWALVGGRLRIARARIDGVTLNLAPAQPATKSPAFSLQPPLAIALDDVVLTRIAVTEAGKPVFAADRLALAGSWSRRRLRIRKLALRAQAGSVDLSGRVALTRGYRGAGKAQIDWTQDATHYAGTLTAKSDGKAASINAALTAPVPMKLAGSLALGGRRAWTLALDAPEFSARVLPALPASLRTLALNLHGAGDERGGKLEGRITANGHVLLIDPAQFRYDAGTLTLAPLRLRSPSMPGVAAATGVVHLDATPQTAALEVSWQGVQPPADLVGQVLATRGNLKLRGSVRQFTAKGAFALGPPDQVADFSVDLAGTPRSVQLHALKLVQKHGSLDVRGAIALQPHLTWKLDAVAQRFDPGALLAGWNGALGFTLQSNGALTARGPEATLKLDRTAGTLRGRAISGSSADLHVTPDNWLDGTLQLVAGASRVRATGKPGPRTDAAVTLDVASLGDWLPNAAGSLRGQFTVKGAWPKLAIAGHLHGEGLRDGARKVARLQLDAALPNLAQPGGNLDLALQDVQVTGLDFASVRLTGSGTAASHDLQLDARGNSLGLALALRGSWQEKSRKWTGTLSGVELSPRGMPPWRQQQPTTITWQAGALSMSQLCLAAGAPTLCITASRTAKGALGAQYQLQSLPLQLLTTLAPGTTPLQATGELSGSGKISLGANGALDGSTSLATNAGSIAFAANPGSPLLAWSSLGVDAELAGANQRVRLQGRFADGGDVTGNVTVSGAQHALAGSIDANLRSLAFLEALSPEVANVHGTVGGSLQLAGTLAAPQFEGRIETRSFNAELPRAGLKLHDGDFAIAGDPQGRLAISGQITSGKGVLHIEGSTGLSADAPLSVSIKGENVLVADIPAAHVLASPDLRIARSNGVLALTGDIAIPSAEVAVEKLPGEGPTQASPDVVIVDAPPASPVAPLALSADITVKLGDAVKVQGYGLDGRVQGQLAVTVKPGQTATGRGQITVSGKYQAYGQDLTIERGRLLFAGTRLDDPGLDIRAVRAIRSQNLTVGLSVHGTAQRPALTVFSDPSMEQTEALSYLVTGRPLNQLKSGEGSTLDAAAQALGGLAGDRIAKSIGSRLGLEAGVASSEALGGSAFTAGKYLSPRLFLSYGVGLFTPGQVITLRYTLNRFLQFEAENATTGNRASLNYRIEK